MEQEDLINRELSWLSFNERVLQEAIDESNPLIERIRFLGIFSNNRDEFFRVRVASLKRMLTLGKKTRRKLYDDPEELLRKINEVVIRQETNFLSTYKSLVDELHKHEISLVNNTELNESQKDFVLSYFEEVVRPTLVPLMLSNASSPDLTDKTSYLGIKISLENEESKYALIEIPASIIPRFLVLPPQGASKFVMYLDDVIRLGLSQMFKIFSYTSVEAFAVRLTRDAELDIDEDIDESLMEKLSKSVSKRKIANPVRFVHDKDIPDDLLGFLIKSLQLNDTGNIISSGRYHNLRDLMQFPNMGAKSLINKEWQAARHPDLINRDSLLQVIEKKDIFLHYPYQTFSHTIDILREAAIDPKVTRIKINIYRTAPNSKIVNALINASKNGKEVQAVMELRARFDEERNMSLSRRLQENGVQVIFGVEGLKVHCKLILIERKKKNEISYIAHVGTGNFHEGNAKIYTDASLWTGHQKITNEVRKIFDFFKSNYKPGKYKELIVSPFNTRRKMGDLIDREIENALNGLPSYIVLKMNSLVDDELVNHLYKASKAGVKIQLIVRGICSLIPQLKEVSENIEAISILDRYLEHSRVMIFCNGTKAEKIYITSGDIMGRNLDRRVEVGVPIYDENIKAEIRDVIDIMLSDNTKARIIDAELSNSYKVSPGKKIRSQREIHKYYQDKELGNRE